MYSHVKWLFIVNVTIKSKTAPMVLLNYCSVVAFIVMSVINTLVITIASITSHCHILIITNPVSEPSKWILESYADNPIIEYDKRQQNMQYCYYNYNSIQNVLCLTTEYE